MSCVLYRMVIICTIFYRVDRDLALAIALSNSMKEDEQCKRTSIDDFSRPALIPIQKTEIEAKSKEAGVNVFSILMSPKPVVIPKNKRKKKG